MDSDVYVVLYISSGALMIFDAIQRKQLKKTVKGRSISILSP